MTSHSQRIIIIAANVQPVETLLGVSPIATNLKSIKRNEKRIFRSSKHDLVKPHESVFLSYLCTYSLDLRPMHQLTVPSSLLVFQVQFQFPYLLCFSFNSPISLSWYLSLFQSCSFTQSFLLPHNSQDVFVSFIFKSHTLSNQEWCSHSCNLSRCLRDCYFHMSCFIFENY